DSAHFPIQYAFHVCNVRCVKHHVVVLVVIMDKRGPTLRWQPLPQPSRYLLYFRKIMSLGTVVALDPSAHLTLEITFRLAQIHQSDGRVIQAVQVGERVNERAAERSSHFRCER